MLIKEGEILQRRILDSMKNEDDQLYGKPSDLDMLRSQFRFIPEEQDDDPRGKTIRKLSDQLDREFALVDFAFDKRGLGLRWRVQKEVVAGKGQFICANVTCKEKHDLRTFEVPFEYNDIGDECASVSKRSLVKVRVCQDCSIHLRSRKIRSKKKLEDGASPEETTSANMPMRKRSKMLKTEEPLEEFNSI